MRENNRKSIEKKLMESIEKDETSMKHYVKMRRKLFQTYALVGALFSGIGIAGYYDSVAEEWIELRENHLKDMGRSLSRVAVDISKLGACAGVMHSITSIVIVVIGLAYMGRLADYTGMTDFMLNSRIWFFGYGSWDSKLSMIVNANLCLAMFFFSVAAVASVFNRVDNPYTYVVGFYSVPIVAYGTYFVYSTVSSWNRGYSKKAILEKKSINSISATSPRRISVLHLAEVRAAESDLQSVEHNAVGI